MGAQLRADYSLTGTQSRTAKDGERVMKKRVCSRMGIKWAVPRYKREWQNICAMLPAYLEDGTNGTKVTFLDSKEEHVRYRLQWVLDDLLGSLCTSRAILTKQSQRYLGKNARRVPLIASAELALVPVKGREALGSNDATTGYVVMRHVEDVIPQGKENIIFFTGDTQIRVQDSTRTLWANLNLTKELLYNIQQEKLQNYQSNLKEEPIWQSTPLPSMGA